MNHSRSNVKSIFSNKSADRNVDNKKSERVGGNLQVIKEDNLCLVLGVNRAIEYLLNQKDITTYEQLSFCTPAFISSVTNKAVTAYSNTWVHQAQLAKKGKWNALSVYQYHIRLKTAGKLAYDEV